MQQRRTEIVREFLDGRHSVLVATNVLARGVDLQPVHQVSITCQGLASHSHCLSDFCLVVCLFCLFVVCLQVFVFDFPSSLLEFIHQVIGLPHCNYVSTSNHV